MNETNKQMPKFCPQDVSRTQYKGGAEPCTVDMQRAVCQRKRKHCIIHARV